MKRSPYCLFFLLTFAAASWGVAESWTVQTVAFRDLRQAQAVVEELRALGFDAYAEFALFHNQQFVRVRVGCYASRAGANRLARLLKGNVTADAVVVPFTPGAAAGGCVRREVGFLKPDRWQLSNDTPTSITFRVEVGGREAFVRFDGSRWQILQRPDDAATSNERQVRAAQTFVQSSVLGRPVVEVLTPTGPRIVCPGTLVWQAGSTAVVDDGELMVACSWQAQEGST